MQPTPRAQMKWQNMGMRALAGIGGAGPITAARDLVKVLLYVSNEQVRVFGKHRGVVGFTKLEPSHVQAGLVCGDAGFEDYNGHAHNHFSVDIPPDQVSSSSVPLYLRITKSSAATRRRGRRASRPTCSSSARRARTAPRPRSCVAGSFASQQRTPRRTRACGTSRSTTPGQMPLRSSGTGAGE
jgi:hypothetical protein